MSLEKRFAAKLLFQYRVGAASSSQFRTCEERTVLLEANSEVHAFEAAMKIGRAAQTKYQNDEGETVHFECVGVVDLLELGIECEDNEVWYEVKTLLRPMERKSRLVLRLSNVGKGKALERPERRAGS